LSADHANFPHRSTQVVTAEQGQALADELGLRYVETSAKANTQVEDAFFTLARDVKARLIDTASAGASATGAGSAGAGGQGIDVNSGANAKGNSSCCS
jgi:Ras-related protein Rab-8A